MFLVQLQFYLLETTPPAWIGGEIQPITQNVKHTKAIDMLCWGNRRDTVRSVA